MASTTFDWTSLIPGLGSGLMGLLQGIFQPRPNSFTDANNSDIDPRNVMAQEYDWMRKIGPGLMDRASKPVTLRSSYAQGVPTFAGGGLPMPIGLFAQDPAVNDKSLLSIPGLDLNVKMGGPPTSNTPPNPPNSPGVPTKPTKPGLGFEPPPDPNAPPKDPYNPNDPNNPNNQPPPDDGAITPTSRGGKSPQFKVGDHDQAMAAFRLLGMKV